MLYFQSTTSKKTKVSFYSFIFKQSPFFYCQQYKFINHIFYTQECRILIFILQPMLSEPPIKKRIETLKEQIVAIRGVNADCKKQLIMIEKQIKILQSRLHDPFSVVKDYFAIAKDTLRTQFEKQSILFDEQTEFLQNQIHQMIDDKLKAHQNCLILEEKIRHLNEDIG